MGVAPLPEYQGVSERFWGVNVNAVNEIFVLSFSSCDYPLKRRGCHLLVKPYSVMKKKISLANIVLGILTLLHHRPHSPPSHLDFGDHQKPGCVYEKKNIKKYFFDFENFSINFYFYFQ